MMLIIGLFVCWYPVVNAALDDEAEYVVSCCGVGDVLKV